MKLRIVLIAIALSSPITWADDAAVNAEALQKTQDLLKNPDEREEAIKKDPSAVKVNDNIKDLTGGDSSTTNGIFNLSADAFGIINTEAGGDPKKMQELLKHYREHPEEFAEKFSPEMKAKLHETAERIPARNNRN